MINKQSYKLTFLPLFEEDLLKATDYITNTLQNSSAAHRLVSDIELAIVKRLEMPLSFAPYQSSKIRNRLYYRINVRNFSICLRIREKIGVKQRTNWIRQLHETLY